MKNVHYNFFCPTKTQQSKDSPLTNAEDKEKQQIHTSETRE